ncbi:MAG TPA: signal peptidase II [Tepidisphaeraceae bacterium]|jgi:signal peptidase II|nr:signal peptidase II [Tepidisphaeraceae bacterium]
MGALAFFLTAFLGVGIDLWTKDYAFDHLAIYRGTKVVDSEVYRFIPGWLEFTVTTNQGAVFGIGAGQRFFFISVSLAAILFLIYLFSHSAPHRIYQIILGMLLAGVLGNLYDRIVFGYVRDMIHALPARHWPGTWTLPFIDYPGPSRAVFPWIFNVADVLLCTGVALMILYSLLHSGREPQNVGAETPKPQINPNANR